MSQHPLQGVDLRWKIQNFAFWHNKLKQINPISYYNTWNTFFLCLFLMSLLFLLSCSESLFIFLYFRKDGPKVNLLWGLSHKKGPFSPLHVPVSPSSTMKYWIIKTQHLSFNLHIILELNYSATPSVTVVSVHTTVAQLQSMITQGAGGRAGNWIHTSRVSLGWLATRLSFFQEKGSPYLSS